MEVCCCFGGTNRQRYPPARSIVLGSLGGPSAMIAAVDHKRELHAPVRFSATDRGRRGPSGPTPQPMHWYWACWLCCPRSSLVLYLASRTAVCSASAHQESRAVTLEEPSLPNWMVYFRLDSGVCCLGSCRPCLPGPDSPRARKGEGEGERLSPDRP